MAVRVGLYGSNGHQIYGITREYPDVELVAIAGGGVDRLSEEQQADPQIRQYETLEELLADDRVELVSLCSPLRSEQAADAIRCLEAGRHVYAEKPCAMTEADLDAIIATAKRTGKAFHEMAGSSFMQPFPAIREVVTSGKLGTIVQFFAQKSYPMRATRPQDEAIDGGLTCQAGVHAFRWIEQVIGSPIAEVQAWETQLGNPGDGDLRVASSCLLRLESGVLGSVVINYLNQQGLGSWGNEAFRIFGTDGMVEAVDGARRTRLILGDEDLGPLVVEGEGREYFRMFADSLQGKGDMPLSLEDELHPTRMVIRAKESAS